MTAPSRSQPTTGHTPTPWVADPDWREGYSWNIHILDGANPDMRICFMTSDGPAEANAALIVDAVNNYAALKARVAELEARVAILDFCSSRVDCLVRGEAMKQKDGSCEDIPNV